MKRLRPLAGAMLAILLLLPAGYAAEVDNLTPPGPTDLAPPGTGIPSDTGPAIEDTPSASERSTHDGPSDWPFDNRPTLQTRHFGPQAALSCAVADKPGAIVVINEGSEDLPVGTRIKWQLPGERGFFALLTPLGAGKTLVADNVLSGIADGAAACTARTI